MSRVVVLDFRERNIGGATVRPTLWSASGCRLGVDALRALGQEHRLTFLIHGFNVSREWGRKSGKIFADLMHEVRGSDPLGYVVVVLWPGDHLFGALTYSFQQRDADRTAAELRRAVQEHIRPVAPLNFVAHSLGCRVALETIKQLYHCGVAVDQVVLMAGAVDCDALARSSRYAAAVRAAGRVATVASRRDRVLQYAFPVGDAIAALLDGGYTRVALGRDGPRPARRPEPEPIPGTVVSLSVTEYGVGHSDYLPGDKSADSKHKSAAKFSAECVFGVPSPEYCDPKTIDALAPGAATGSP